MPKYFVASAYFEYDLDLDSNIYEAESPLEAIIADCMRRCGLKDHEACHSVETESFQINVWLIHAGGPRRLDWDDYRFPWNMARDCVNRIAEIEEAISMVQKLNTLSSIPGVEIPAINLAAARDEITRLREERQQLNETWEARKLPPVGEDRDRVVQVDKPQQQATENVATT